MPVGGGGDLGLVEVAHGVGHPAAQPLRRVADAQGRDVAEPERRDRVLRERVREVEAVDLRREVGDPHARHRPPSVQQPRAGQGDGSPPVYPPGMCRSIKTLRRADEAATTGELEAAARQYVRKISGYRTPSARNAEAFEAAIAEIAIASDRLLEALGVAVEEGPDRWTPGSAARPARHADRRRPPDRCRPSARLARCA